MRFRRLLFILLIFITSNADEVSNVINSMYSSKESINENIYKPISNQKNFRTYSGKDFSAPMSCPSTNKAVVITFNPVGGNDYTATISIDTNIDGRLDYTYSTPNISGICTNGIVSCSPGTWSNCNYYYWQADTSLRLSLVRTNNLDSRLGVCSCSNGSCGYSSIDQPLFGLIGGGVSQALQKINSYLAISQSTWDGNQLILYGYNPKNCSGATSSNSDLTIYYESQHYPQSDLASQSNHPAYSVISSVPQGQYKDNKQIGMPNYQECMIRNDVILVDSQELNTMYICNTNNSIFSDLNMCQSVCGSCSMVKRLKTNAPICDTSKYRNFIAYNGRTYAITRQSAPWDSFPEDIKSKFITIHNSGENNIANYFTKYYGTSWIGLHKVCSQTCKWVWVDGSPLDYQRWEPGEPNNCCGGEYYVEMYPQGTWNDRNSNHPAIVEFPEILDCVNIEAPLPNPKLASTNTCPSNCELVDEYVCNKDGTNCVQTIKDYKKLDVILLKQCYENSGDVLYLVCSDGNSITVSSKEYGTYNVGGGWFYIKRKYKCGDLTLDVNLDRAKQTLRTTDRVDGNINTYSYTDPNTGQYVSGTLNINPNNCPAPACTVRTISKDTQTFSDGTNRNQTASGSTTYPLEIRICKDNQCPVSQGEIIVENCTCDMQNMKAGFNSAISTMAAIYEASKDMICSK